MCDSEEEENEDWNKPVDTELSKNAEGCQVEPSCQPKTTNGGIGLSHQRVILHIDIDCFYAQVEMIRNPALRNKPLGIQQKYIVVTCNYPARELGVTKLMRITDAKEKCPNLVLVSGEDLTHYREMSYKISNFLQKYCPLVERLGFDENFLDITELVNDRISSGANVREVKGHVYNEEQVRDVCVCGCHERLKVGSQVSADIRDGLYTELGITSCGGVAVNKLLSKLVAGKHKPNQQTTLFPEQTGSLMGELTNVRQIPGIGHTTGRRLKEIGISSVHDLQNADKTTLEEEFGNTSADNMKNLCFGIDDSPVIAFGLPQTLSDEDSFKKCSSIVDVKNKLRQLITSLLERLLIDGRTPHTFRLTVRKIGAGNKYLNKESRQCPLSSTLFSKFSQDTLSNVCSQLEIQAYNLFVKLVDTKNPFHLTLINVAFAKLEHKSSNSITKFFSPNKSSTPISANRNRPGPNSAVNALVLDNSRFSDSSDVSTKTPEKSENQELIMNNKSKGALDFGNNVNKDTELENGASLTENQSKRNANSSDCESRKDKNGLYKWFGKYTSKEGSMGSLSENEDIIRKSNTIVHANAFEDKAVGVKRKSIESLNDVDLKRLKPDNQTRVFNGSVKQMDIIIPEHVDKSVFLELPADIQKEILESSKQEHHCNTQKHAATPLDKERSTMRDMFNIGSRPEHKAYMACKEKSSFFSKVIKGKSEGIASPSPKTYSRTVGHLDSNCNIVTSEIEDSRETSARINCDKTTGSSDMYSETIPPHIDKDVFGTLPAEIQKELKEDWKRKQMETMEKGQASFSVKSPLPSTGNNIMSYFPKANKK